MNQPLTTHTTNTLLALYALLDTEHKDRARQEIEELMEIITRPDEYHPPTGVCAECGNTDVELFPDEPMRITRCPVCGSCAIDEGLTPWPQQQEEESTARLLAEIAEQDGVNNDEAEYFYDPSDRF